VMMPMRRIFFKGCTRLFNDYRMRKMFGAGT